MKSSLRVSPQLSLDAAPLTVRPCTPPRSRSITVDSAEPSSDSGSAVLSTRSWSLSSATSSLLGTGAISRTFDGTAMSWATCSTASVDHGPVRQLAPLSTSFLAAWMAEAPSSPWSCSTARTVCSASTSPIASLICAIARFDAFLPALPSSFEGPLSGSAFPITRSSCLEPGPSPPPPAPQADSATIKPRQVDTVTARRVWVRLRRNVFIAAVGSLRSMATVQIEGIEGLQALKAETIGPSEWREVTQEDINNFADLTNDHQWIHVDVERAKIESPFGTTVAHGNLTLSLIDGMRLEMMNTTGFKLGVNYGWNKVRFPAPVPAGSRVRTTGEIVEVEDVGGGWWQIVTRFAVEVEGSEKPACVADSVGRALPD